MAEREVHKEANTVAELEVRMEANTWVHAAAMVL